MEDVIVGNFGVLFCRNPRARCPKSFSHVSHVNLFPFKD